MIAAFLARIGLSALGPETQRMIGMVAVAAALIAGGLYVVHAIGARGYDKATKECRDAALAALDAKREAEAQLAEVNREVIIRHTGDATALAAAVPVLKKEVFDYAKANPTIRVCSLNDAGLSLWNADPVRKPDATLPVRPGIDGTQPGQPPASDQREPARPDRQPDRLEGRLQNTLFETPRPLRTGRQLHHRADASGGEVSTR